MRQKIDHQKRLVLISITSIILCISIVCFAEEVNFLRVRGTTIRIGFTTDHGQLSSSTILCNLTSNLLPSSKNYERIIEIVENSEEAKQNSRHKYRAYQKEGFEIQVIPLNE